jgi:hypothetical protein
MLLVECSGRGPSAIDFQIDIYKGKKMTEGVEGKARSSGVITS